MTSSGMASTSGRAGGGGSGGSGKSGAAGAAAGRAFGGISAGASTGPSPQERKEESLMQHRNDSLEYALRYAIAKRPALSDDDIVSIAGKFYNFIKTKGGSDAS